jgi:hypothetical protein
MTYRKERKVSFHRLKKVFIFYVSVVTSEKRIEYKSIISTDESHAEPKADENFTQTFNLMTKLVENHLNLYQK